MALTIKQEKYVQNLIQGMSQREAYKNSYNAKNMKDDTIDNKACALLRKGEIKARHDELRNKVIEKLEDDTVFTIKSVLDSLKDILDRNIGADDKIALETLKTAGKHLGMFTDKVETINHNINQEVTSEEEAKEILRKAGIDPEKV